ncbi:hypothetical protein LRP52_39940 [Photobacterium sp. ZSDE20]|uniref:Lipoprotein n=1 Tax=Photobacterium pectinilyticum TaxID=2906793 RepID=A0ABT1N7J5_9GAMM|nr:hypothetical protein [Photobacterium sp. ZSDE20]MCQ1060720.1 hypothetical protein [Photobacterium sp. ZSDE20]MDD1828353.1 hypothetical protein [Photobacterium sp. ZSDE20]
MKKTTILSLITSITLLSGCANTPESAIDIKAKKAKSYSLNSDKFSEPTRLLYPLTWIKPERKTNNLDQFYMEAPKNTVQNVGQATAFAAGALGMLTAGDAIIDILGFGSSKTEYSPRLGSAMLFTVTTFDKKDDWESQSLAVTQLNHIALKNAAESDMFIEDSSHEHFLSRYWLAHELSNKHCHGLSESDDFSAKSSPNLCYSITSYNALVNWDNNGHLPLMPNGDVISARTILAPGFPIERLTLVESEQSIEQYLYVPPLALSPVRELFFNQNHEQTIEWLESKRLSLHPYLKRLSDGKIMYFNPRVEKEMQTAESAT